jgi:hypothetical protein
MQNEDGQSTPQLDRPTRTQRIVLEWEVDGMAELQLQTGLSGASLQASIEACKRRQWLSDDGRRTDAGDAALLRTRAWVVR